MRRPQSHKQTKASSTYAFIDASNIIYGTRDEGWQVDFKKLFKYLKERYKCRKMYYFAGLDPGNKKQIRFYNRLEKFGFELVLKKVKIYRQPGRTPVRKANCDVDLDFYAMRDKEKYNRALFLTGDGDFFYSSRLSSETEKESVGYRQRKADCQRDSDSHGVKFYTNEIFTSYFTI